MGKKRTDRIVAALEAQTAAIVAALRAQGRDVHIHQPAPGVATPWQPWPGGGIVVGDRTPPFGGQIISGTNTVPGSTVTINASRRPEDPPAAALHAVS